MRGMNAATGRTITGIDHLQQSINKILSTLVGTRIKRRQFGSVIPSLIDAPLNSATRLRLYSATATALMSQEPRLKLTSVSLAISTDAPSATVLDIEGITSDTGESVSSSVSLTGSVA